MIYFRKIAILLFLLSLLIIAGCGSSAPTKTIIPLNESSINGNGHSAGSMEDVRTIVDSQGNILHDKSITTSGGLLSELFIGESDLLGGYSDINHFIESEGAKTSGTRTSGTYYPLNLNSLLSGNNLFKIDYWKSNEGLSSLLELERENLKLEDLRVHLIDREKSHSIEDDRFCYQGGKMLSNQIYYRSENSACYGTSSSDCKAQFGVFPIFKTCSSLTNIRDTFTIPSEWSDSYSITCNFNSNYATLPSFLRSVNVGYSHCLLKKNSDSEKSILVGYGVGNSHVEADLSQLELSAEDFFMGQSISSTTSLSPQTITVKNRTQEARDLGKHVSSSTITTTGLIPVFSPIKIPLSESYINSTVVDINNTEKLALLTEPLRGTTHVNSYQDKVTSNYLLLESFESLSVQVEAYKVTLEDNTEYYVYLDNYSTWFAVSSYELDLNEFYNSYTEPSGEDQLLPSRSGERIYVDLTRDGSRYTLIEESETLFYKSGNLFSSVNDFTTYPVYKLRITNVNSDMCDKLFKLYDYEETSGLSYGESLSCVVDGSTLRANLNEKYFSLNNIEDSQRGGGYILMRNILYPN